MRGKLEFIVLVCLLSVLSGCSSIAHRGQLDLCDQLNETIACVGKITEFSVDTIERVGGQIYDTTLITVIEPNVSRKGITVLSEGLPEGRILRDIGGIYRFKIKGVFLVNRDDCPDVMMHSIYLAFPEDIEFEKDEE